eukprot:gene1763-4875_t
MSAASANNLDADSNSIQKLREKLRLAEQRCLQAEQDARDADEDAKSFERAMIAAKKKLKALQTQNVQLHPDANLRNELQEALNREEKLKQELRVTHTRIDLLEERIFEAEQAVESAEQDAIEADKDAAMFEKQAHLHERKYYDACESIELLKRQIETLTQEVEILRKASSKPICTQGHSLTFSNQNNQNNQNQSKDPPETSMPVPLPSLPRPRLTSEFHTCVTTTDKITVTARPDASLTNSTIKNTNHRPDKNISEDTPRHTGMLHIAAHENSLSTGAEEPYAQLSKKLPLSNSVESKPRNRSESGVGDMIARFNNNNQAQNVHSNLCQQKHGLVPSENRGSSILPSKSIHTVCTDVVASPNRKTQKTTLASVIRPSTVPVTQRIRRIGNASNKTSETNKKKTGKEAMLAWCQNIAKGVEITNFSSSFADGMAFIAILHHFYPSEINMSQHTPSTRRLNFETAFRVADECGGVYPLLDTEDMVAMSRPDALSVMTYISQLHKKLAKRS